jgi:hypothetical protein
MNPFITSVSFNFMGNHLELPDAFLSSPRRLGAPVTIAQYYP